MWNVGDTVMQKGNDDKFPVELIFQSYRIPLNLQVKMRMEPSRGSMPPSAVTRRTSEGTGWLESCMTWAATWNQLGTLWPGHLSCSNEHLPHYLLSTESSSTVVACFVVLMFFGEVFLGFGLISDPKVPLALLRARCWSWLLLDKSGS